MSHTKLFLGKCFFTRVLIMSTELQSSQQKVVPMLAPDLRKIALRFLQNHAIMIEWDHLFYVSILPHCLFAFVKLDLSDCLAFTDVCCHRQMMEPLWKNQDLVLWLPLVRNRFLLGH